MKVTPGSTDVTTYFSLVLSSDGSDATALTITDLDLQYVRSGVAPVAKVDATALAATDSAHSDNKAIEVDATDQPGLYRVDWPDAAFAAGVREVILTVKHSSCRAAHLRVELETLQTGDNFARLGAPAGASVSADVAAVKSDTAAILVDTGTTLDARIPAALVGGRMDSSVGAMAANTVTATAIAADAITAAKIATGAIDADALATDAINEIADGFLDRDMSTGADNGSTTVRTPRQALRFLRNKWSISGTTLTVTKEDDATTSWSSTITTNASAEPITANDPAGP